MPTSGLLKTGMEKAKGQTGVTQKHDKYASISLIFAVSTKGRRVQQCNLVAELFCGKLGAARSGRAAILRYDDLSACILSGLATARPEAGNVLRASASFTNKEMDVS